MTTQLVFLNSTMLISTLLYPLTQRDCSAQLGSQPVGKPTTFVSTYLCFSDRILFINYSRPNNNCQG